MTVEELVLSFKDEGPDTTGAELEPFGPADSSVTNRPWLFVRRVLSIERAQLSRVVQRIRVGLSRRHNSACR